MTIPEDLIQEGQDAVRPNRKSRPIPVRTGPIRQSKGDKPPKTDIDPALLARGQAIAKTISSIGEEAVFEGYNALNDDMKARAAYAKDAFLNGLQHYNKLSGGALGSGNGIESLWANYVQFLLACSAPFFGQVGSAEQVHTGDSWEAPNQHPRQDFQPSTGSYHGSNHSEQIHGHTPGGRKTTSS